jgi:orotidine-5'-phosphate decarboxylase
MKDRIIVPLDVPDTDSAISLVDRLPEVEFWKVGLELFVGSGGGIINALKQRDKKVFLDLKFHDIPNTVAGACRSAAKYGVDLLTVHSSAGGVALEGAMAAVREGAAMAGVAPPKVIAISLLTSINSQQLTDELHVPLPLAEYTLNMALLARSSGIDGAVTSPQEVASLRASCGRDFLLVCPGVRPSWAETGDQQRIMTPKMAIAAGADYLVIGRPITAATDPQAAWARILAELVE